ncbi:CaiB/BaiF CoA transferase family protein [Acuticoccus sp.]|uniref:CaiB/BaiF CoA transferase family protein n=1 Tax=Acuticoccus sp. TaxID=1904378 RepID=UPI003B51C288
MTQPIDDLSGLLVVAVEQAVAAPYASSRLAEAGARVVKVERPEGDFARGYDTAVNGASAYFVWLNRGKESVCLDLKAADDRAVLEALVADADVLIENLLPGAMARLGLAPADLRERHPRLITCSISGYGEDGPLAHLKAYDLLVQAESGLAAITGAPEGPGRVGVSVCDIAAGMTALSAILQALYARERTGEGRHIAVSLYHALADWMNVPYLQHVYGGRTPRRSGLAHPSIAPYGAFDCRDGAILIAVQNEREWVRLCAEVLGRPDIATDPRFASNPARVANRAAMEAIVASVFAAADRATMARRLEAAGIAYGRLSTMDDVASHPQNRFVTVDTPSGPARMLAPGYTVAGRAHRPGPVPELGGHTEAIRAAYARTNA